MRIFTRPITLFIALVMASGTGCSSGDGPDRQIAEEVFVNAEVFTVDSENSWAEAFAIRGGKLVAVGSNEEVKSLADPDTKVTDLGGRMVMPGIHDTHLHPMDAGIQKIECHFLSNDLAEVLSVLKSCIAQTPKGEWIRGGQWNDALFASGKLPKEILDEIAPDHPVFLMDWTVHNAWVNTRALEVFGIDDETPDPSGGVIVRSPSTGEATGILIDNAAYNNRRRLPAYDLEQRTEALARSLDLVARHGVTTIKDAIVTESTIEAYKELDRKGQLQLRVNTSLTWKSAWAKSHADEQTLIDRRSNHAAERINTSFAKIMLDGIPPTYTAAMIEPYQPNDAFGKNWRGKLMFPPDELTADVKELDREGLSVKIHATGDRSVRVALDAFEAARQVNGDTGLVHEVSHAEIIHPDDIPRFAELNVAAEMCPILWYPIPALPWELWIGPSRTVWPVRTLVESGALVIYGSDWPVVPAANPWPGIEAMVTRADPAGTSDKTLWEQEAIDLETAIRIFTINGALANGVGDRSGSLEAGKDADFIVLEHNIFDVDIGAVSETQVSMSFVAGQKVFDRTGT